MPLPKPTVPTYELELPSTGKKIKYRPFIVKEEKILLMAMESEDENEIKNAVKDILKNCILTRGVKPEELASFDLEYLFLKIRAASAGEEVSLKVTCQDDNETVVDVDINLNEVEVYKPEGHTNKIMVDDTIGMVMKYPAMDSFVSVTLMENDLETTDEVFEMLIGCIDQIFQDDEVWDAATTPKKELLSFIESFTQQQFEKIQKFFDTMPVLRHEFVVVNPKTGIESSYTLEGLQSFFG
jgi:T4 bacteriophage base plate protein